VTDAVRRKRTTRAATQPEPIEPSTTPAGDAADGTARTAKVRRADGLPRRGTSSPAAEERSSLDLARRIVELAEDKKAADIVLLDLSPLTTVADYFIICSGGSERQLEAIAGGVISGMRDERVRPFGREGTAASHWILVDFGSVIVHVFTPPERDFYQLERHWAEAKTVLRLQ
jgi:ribosome-associated protein